LGGGIEMKILLNNLYITDPDAWLVRDGLNIVVKKEQDILIRVPIHNLENVICFNYRGATAPVMELCLENNVTLSFLDEYGNFKATVVGKTKGNVLLRKEQYRISDDEERSLKVSKNIIFGKIYNSRKIIMRGNREYAERLGLNDSIDYDIKYMKDIINRVNTANCLDELRGIEGEAAKIYFENLDSFILTQKEDFFMKERSKRPPLDNFNALISFIYTVLTREISSAITSVGLDSYVGFLHRDRPGRESLALDLIEELRGFLCDRLAISLINRKQINKKHFRILENNAVYLTDEGKKIVIMAWQSKKSEELIHPYLEEKIKIGLIPYVQAMLLARYIRGDIDDYPVFFIQ
jgi:CRISPR-associated protein Cas1